ncbi:MAG: GerW family sporulation protein [Clostridia bacterium]|nr:GerW family sporulation protein [Clostridia bacterium]MBR6510399.1 GerW family sporulation protein [Clostridia bacterium]
MSDNNIKSIMDTTMDKLKAMVDADVITGTPVVVGDITLIPVSKVAFGLATGGSDFPNKNGAELFGGGGGAGVSVSPIAFIVISGGNVRMMPIYNELTTVEKAISMIPEFVDKAKELIDELPKKSDKTDKE